MSATVGSDDQTPGERKDQRERMVLCSATILCRGRSRSLSANLATARPMRWPRSRGVDSCIGSTRS
jgi:hypothetical protein